MASACIASGTMLVRLLFVSVGDLKSPNALA